MKKIWTKSLSLLLALVLTLGMLPGVAMAEEANVSVTVGVDMTSLADDDMLEAMALAPVAPVTVTVPAGSTVKTALEAAATQGGYTTTFADGMFTEIAGAGPVAGLCAAVGIENAPADFQYAGWMYTQNGQMPDSGAADQIVAQGDEVTFRYTLSYGAVGGGEYASYDWAFMDAYLGVKALLVKAESVAEKDFTLEQWAAIQDAKTAGKTLADELYEQSSGLWISYIAGKATGLWGPGSPTEKAQTAEKNLRNALDKVVSPTGIQALPTEVKIPAGGTYQLQPVVLPEGAPQDVTYEAFLGETSFTVTDTGLVTGIKTDTMCWIKVAVHGDNSKFAFFKFAVVEALPPVDETAEKIDTLMERISAGYADTTSDWAMFEMATLGRDDELTKRAQVVPQLLNIAATSKTPTDLERVSLCLSALGVDVSKLPGTDGGIYNLPGKIAGMTLTGTNELAFALNAFDYDRAALPEGARDTMIAALLAVEQPGGGWSLSTGDDPDITAMVLAALAPYYLAADGATVGITQAHHTAVKAAVERGVTKLSTLQTEEGFTGWGPWGKLNSNSSSTVIVALSALGIDAHTDPRFIKGGRSAMEQLLSFAVEGDKGFGDKNNTMLNPMATEYGFRALISYQGMKAADGAYSIYHKKHTPAPLPTLTTAVDLRIEGISQGLYSGALAVEHSGVLLTAADVLRAVKDVEITIATGDYGPYITAVDGDVAGTFGGYDGWNYMVGGVAPSVGVGGYHVSPGDRIVLYYGDMDMQKPEIAVAYGGGGAVLTVTSQDTVYDESWNPTVVTNPVSAATLTWHYGDGLTATYTTDAAGKVTIPASQAQGGNHGVQVEKYGTTAVGGKYLPLILRLAPDYMVALTTQQVLTPENPVAKVTAQAAEPLIVELPTSVATGTLQIVDAPAEATSANLPPMDITNYLPDGGEITFQTYARTWYDLNADRTMVLPQKVLPQLGDSGNAVSAVAVGVMGDLGTTGTVMETGKVFRLTIPGGASAQKMGFIGADGTLKELTTVLTEDLGAASASGWLKVAGDMVVYGKTFGTYVAYSPKSTGGDNTDVTVSFTLMGDSGHGEGTEHIYKTDPTAFETWVKKTSVTVNQGASVLDVIEKVLNQAGIPFTNKSGNYISEVQGLAEFDNGPYSGWMYLVNGVHVTSGVADRTVKSGDKIIVHYTDNYTKEQGSESIGGGGGSAGTSPKKETVKHADGSVTTTVTDAKTGTVTATTVYSGGAELKVVTPKTGQAEITATLPKTVQKAVVTVPSRAVTPGTVVMVVEEDGTRRILPKTAAGDGGIKVLLTGSARLVVAENAKDFADVPATHWGADAVAFASARELFIGTGNNAFRPGMKMTVGMLDTVMARLDGQKPAEELDWTTPLTRAEMAKVLRDYAGGGKTDPMEWAKENGILQGRENGDMAPGDTATRAEVAAVLERLVRLLVK